MKNCSFVAIFCSPFVPTAGELGEVVRGRSPELPARADLTRNRLPYLNYGMPDAWDCSLR
jgi:hypothetical protein